MDRRHRRAPTRSRRHESELNPQPAADGSGLRQLVVTSFAARGLTVVLGAIAGVVIARVLAPEGRGAYAVVVTAATTAIAVGHLSIETANLSLWKRSELRASLTANVVLLSMSLGLLVAGLAWLCILVLGEERMPVYSQGGLALALLGVPLGLLGLWTNNLLSLNARVERLNLGLVLSGVLQTGTLLLLASTGRLTVTAVVAVWVASTAAPLLVSLPTLRPRLGAFSMPVLRLQVASGLRFHPGVALLFLLFKVDLLVVNAVRSPRDVGLYALAVTLAELVYLLTDAVSQAIMSRQAGGGMAAADITARAVRINAWGCGGIALALLLSAQVLVPLVYSDDFSGSVAPLMVLLPGVVALAIGRPLAVLLAALDRPGLLAALSTGAFVLHLVALWLLVPPMGIVGAAAASTVGYVSLAAGYLLAGRRLTGTPWQDLLPRLTDLRAVLGR